jgi:phosphatidylinositol glycan class B
MLKPFRKLHAFQDPDWTRTFVIALAFAFILHLLAAIFSVGFYHTDEHFQILEFLNYKLGRSTGAELAVEFGQRM